MKLLHVADMHLDRSFEGLKQLPEAIATQLASANQQMFMNIVDCALKYQVDAVLIAGDTFHQSQTSIRTQALFFDEIHRLTNADIPVIMIFGNHDYYLEEKYWFSFPENVVLLSDETPTTHYFMTKKHEKVAVTGFSYQQSYSQQNKLSEFPIRDQTVDFQIGLYHGELSSSNAEQQYAPFSIKEMKEKGYDYWALGHIHQPEIISTRPLIVYPGTPQGHTKKERETKGVALVHIEKDQSTVQFKEVASIIWQCKTYSLATAHHLQEAMQQVATFLSTIESQSADLSLLELILTDTTHLDYTFQLAIETGEFLHYLQEKHRSLTKCQWFLYRLSQEKTSKEPIQLPASSALLKQLSTTYLRPEVYHHVLAELTNNPLIQSAISTDENWQAKNIQQALKQLDEDFIIQEEQP